MPLKKPASMEECIYFTNRTISRRGDTNEVSIDSGIGSGRAIAWVFRKECIQCKKGFMVKPQLHSRRNPQKKMGRIDKKADHYICNSCSYKESNEDVENSLVLNVEYKCPHCGSEGETTTEYKRKNFYRVKAYVFECQKCGQKTGITQKLKEPKKPSSIFADEEDVDLNSQVHCPSLPQALPEANP